MRGRFKLRLRSRVHCDWLTVRMFGPPSLYAFEPGERGCWHDTTGLGWRAVEGTHHVTGDVYTLATISGPAAYASPDPLIRFPEVGMTPTRMDICREVEGLPVTRNMPFMFAGHRNDNCGMRQSTGGRTVYIGSPKSQWLLRVYEKSSEHPALLTEWASCGWTGADLTRVEYQLKRRAIERAWRPGQVPRGEQWLDLIDALWTDSLARCRLCSRAPEGYRDASDAPTDLRWLALGQPAKIVQHTPVRGGPDPALVERALQRRLTEGLSWADLEGVYSRLAKVYRPR